MNNGPVRGGKGMPRRLVLSAFTATAAYVPAAAQTEPVSDLEQAKQQVKRNAEILSKTAAARDLEPSFRFEP